MAKPLVEVAIGADGSVFVREVDKATGASEKFGASVKKSGDTAKQTAKDVESFGADFGKAAKYVAASAAAAATGAALLVKSAIDSADAANILAGKLNISTESLSKLQYAAKLADVSQGSLESGLRKLAVTLTTAQDPGSKLSKLFEVLGLNVKELIELPADQQLGRIGDALNTVTNANQRAAIAQTIFGKSGQALLPILAEGTAGIKASGDELERFGGVISGDIARRAAEFNDNLDKIKTAAGGLGLSVADQLIAPMTEFQNQLIELAGKKETADGIANFISGIGTALVTTANIIATTTNVWRYLGEEIAAALGGPAVGDFERINDAINTAKNGIAYLEGKQKALSGGLQVRSFTEEDQARLNEYRQELARLEQMLKVSEQLEQDRAKAVKAAADATSAATGQTNSATSANGRNAVSTQAVTDALGGETDAQKAARVAREQATKATDDARRALDNFVQSKRVENALLNVSARDQARYRAQFELTEIAMRGNIEVTDAMRREVDQLVTSTYDATEATKAQEAAMREAEKATNPWAEALTGAVERIDSAFADLWKGTFDGFSDFADNLKNAFKQLLAELAHEAITKRVVLNIAAAFGFGKSSAAMAGGGGGFSLGGIGSLFSGAKNFLGGFKTGGLAGGFDALVGGGMGGFSAGLSGAYRGLGDLFGAIGLDKLQIFSNAKGAAYGAGSFGESLTQFGGDLLGGIAGGFAGNKLGQAIFGERKTTGIGATAGGVIGSIVPGVGTLLGSFLGSLAENAIGKIFGLGDQAKWGKLGITTGANIPTDGSAIETITGASGLTLSAVAKRTDAESAKQLLEGFNAIDSALTAAARAAGLTIDFTNKVLGNTSLDVGNEGPKNSFGVGARLDRFSAEAIKGSADEFARAWLAEIDDQITARIKNVLGDTSRKTADQIVSLFTAAADLDRLLNIDVLELTAEAAQDAAQTILGAYDTATQKVVDLAAEYDGTAESLTTLTAALTEQKAVAVQLAEQYRQVSLAVTAQFGDAIGQIQDSLLNEADLYAKRRQQIADLTTELSTTIDPARIAAISDQINELAMSAYSLLDDGQRAALGAEFVAFLENARDLATAQLTAGANTLGTREDAVAASIDLELIAQASQTQQQAANTFADAVTVFAGIMGGGVNLNLDWEAIAAAIQARGAEVNG